MCFAGYWAACAESPHVHTECTIISVFLLNKQHQEAIFCSVKLKQSKNLVYIVRLWTHSLILPVRTGAPSQQYEWTEGRQAKIESTCCEPRSQMNTSISITISEEEEHSPALLVFITFSHKTCAFKRLTQRQTCTTSPLFPSQHLDTE